MLPVAGLAKGHIAVCVILAQSWNRGSECFVSTHCRSADVVQTSAAMHHQVILLLQCSAALKCQLEILTVLLAAGHILGPVAGVGLLVVQQPTNAELLSCCAWRESSVKMWNIKMPPWTRLALLTSGDSHRSSRSSSACRKSRGQRCRRASRSAQCSVADLGGLGVRVQASRMGRNVATRHWQQGQGKCAGGAPGPCPARRAATSDLRPVATAAHRHFTH